MPDQRPRTRFIFITGGVVSSLGKGIAAASIGRLLVSRGLKVALPVHPLEKIERLEQLRPLAHGMRIGVAILDVAARSGIDTEADLEHANSLWATFTSES